MTSIQEIIKLILTIIFLFFIGFKAESIAFGFIFSFLFVAVIGWFWALKEYKALPKSDETVNSFLLLKEMVPFGLTFVFLSSMGMINSYTDRIMLGYFFPGETGASMIGIYTIVIGFSSIVGIFGGVILYTSFYPLITGLWAKKDTAEMNRITITAMRWILLSSIPLLLAILLFPKQILTIIYGQNYDKGDIALILYSLGLFINLFSILPQYILSAMKRLDISTKIIAVATVSNIILNFIFIPLYGINGAAFASAVSFAVMSALFLRTNKITSVKFPKDLYKPVIAGIIAVVLLFLVKPYISEILSNLPALIKPTDIVSDIAVKLLKMLVLGTVVSVVFLIYLIFLILFKVFHNEDIEILSGALRRFKVPKKWISLTERILLR